MHRDLELTNQWTPVCALDRIVPDTGVAALLNGRQVAVFRVGAEDPRALRSPPLDTDDRFAFTFAAPGTYRYFCSLHPHMHGAVVVR